MTQLKYSNIFEAIADSKEEAVDLEFRSDLLIIIRDIVESRAWNQKKVMEILDISQPRTSDLLRGKVDKFSSDILLGYLGRLGFKFKPRFEAQVANNELREELFCAVKQTC